MSLGERGYSAIATYFNDDAHVELLVCVALEMAFVKSAHVSLADISFLRLNHADVELNWREWRLWYEPLAVGFLFDSLNRQDKRCQ